MSELAPAGQANNFELKERIVELVPRRDASPGPSMTIEELEAMRVATPAVPASKHGLEAICGPSCETGAH